MYSGSARALADRMNRSVRFSDGTVATVGEIWAAHPMAPERVTPERCAAVDLSEGGQRAGPNGETMREMLALQYGCTTPDEVERVLRRWIAS